MQFELLLAWESGLNYFHVLSWPFLAGLTSPVNRGVGLTVATCTGDWSTVGMMRSLMIFSTPSPHPTHLLVCRIAHMGIILKAGWSISISVISICLQAFLGVLGCPPKAQTGGLCKRTLSWNKMIRSFCKMVYCVPFTKWYCAGPF